MAMRVNEIAVINCPPEEVWRIVGDPFATARLIPGATLERETEKDTFEGVIKVQFGPREVPINGILSITEWDEDASVIKLSGRGADTRKSSRVLFEMTMRVEDISTDHPATRLDMDLEATFTGPLAAIAKTGGQRIAAGLVRRFAERLNAEGSSPAADETAPAAPVFLTERPSLWARLRARIARRFKRPAATG